MMFGYANGSARKAIATQRETLEAFGVQKIWADEKGDDGDWLHLTGEGTGLSRGGPHEIVVAEFHLLATNRAGLLDRLKTIFERGAVVVEAMTGRRTSNQRDYADMLLEATDFYRGGMSKAERIRIAKLGAAASPVTKLKDGRMPLTEAIKFLYDVNLTIREAIAYINRDRRYRRKWSLSFAYQRNKAGDIKLPQRIAGPKLKRT
jgi:hypothetical protein